MDDFEKLSVLEAPADDREASYALEGSGAAHGGILPPDRSAYTCERAGRPSRGAPGAATCPSAGEGWG